MNNISGVQFSFLPGERFVRPHRIEAYVGDKKVGSMDWHMATGRLLGIEVEEPFRRQGIATGMWQAGQEAASRTVKRPVHSSERTNLGEQWAKSVGGKLPRRSHA